MLGVILLFKLSENLIASPYFEQKKLSEFTYNFFYLICIQLLITLELFVRITTLISKNTSSRYVLKDLNLSQSLKGKWQQNFLSSHLKETPKQYIEVYYRILISALLGEIF